MPLDAANMLQAEPRAEVPRSLPPRRTWAAGCKFDPPDATRTGVCALTRAENHSLGRSNEREVTKPLSPLAAAGGSGLLIIATGPNRVVKVSRRRLPKDVPREWRKMRTCETATASNSPLHRTPCRSLPCFGYHGRAFLLPCEARRR